MPKVSILSAAFNHERFIRDAIDSVLAQTYKNWELIIWDDGSTDQSLRIAKEYESTHPGRIYVFTHDGRANLGQEVTRNKALQKASGDLISLLDTDDVWDAKKLELLVPCFEDEKVGLAHGQTGILSLQKNGSYIKKLNPCGSLGSRDAFGELVFDNFVGAVSILVRKKAIQTGFNASYKTCGEYPLWLEIANRWQVSSIAQTVGYWRHHRENLGSKHSILAKRELVEICEKLLSDENYRERRAEIRKAWLKKAYDYLSELYSKEQFTEAKQVAFEILCQEGQNSGFKTKSKTALIYALLQLGYPVNKPISKVKRLYWELKNPEFGKF
ncbi:MAG: glycosyltransferase family 2 protein [Bacteriovoracia bacterium]